MKKAEYFLSALRAYHLTEDSLLEVIEKRNDFIKTNEETIGEIQNEDVQIIACNSANALVLLTLTYFLK